jgi:hypothetical protein
VPAPPVAAHRRSAPADQQGSALHHGPVSTVYITSLRGRAATLERLRIGCQLTEAMATGFDPLHLAKVFGISDAYRDPLRGQRPTTDRVAASDGHSGSPGNSQLGAAESRRVVALVLRNHELAGTARKQRDATLAGKAAPAICCHTAALPWRYERRCPRVGV